MKSKRKKNHNRINIKKPILKILALLVIVGLNWTGLCAVGGTISAFNDVEDAQENGFQAGVLDFSLNSSAEFSPEELDVGENSVRTIDVNNGAGSNFNYQISAKDLSGDLCDYVSLEANLDSGTVECAEAGLSSFACSSFEFADSEQWVFNATLSSGTPDDLRGSTCSFKISFDGWQQGFSYGAGGFTDTEEIDNEITMAETPVAGVVLNEFLPYPDGAFGDDNDNKPLGEWVELYNNSDSAVDLTGWYITDASGGVGNTVVISEANAAAHLSPATTTISAHGFLVVYMNKAVFNNTGDTVKLFNASDELVDSTSYGVDPVACENTPTPGADNQNDYTRTCDADDVPENKSYARIPDGVGDWVDPIPTPGSPNILDERDATIILAPVVEKNVSGGDGEVTEETVLEEEEEPTEEVLQEEENETAEDSTIADEPENAPEDVVEDAQPELESEPEPEPELAQDQDVVIETANDDLTQEELSQEPAIEQSPVIEPEPAAEPADDNSGSDGSLNNGETSGETAE